MKTHRPLEQDGLVRYLMAKWGVTRSRVNQIEQNALRKIRNAVLTDPELRALATEFLGKPPSGDTVSLDKFFKKKPRKRVWKSKRKEAAA